MELAFALVVNYRLLAGYVTAYVTVEQDIPVYSDVIVESIGKERIGSCGFEPQTPTVSR